MFLCVLSKGKDHLHWNIEEVRFVEIAGREFKV